MNTTSPHAATASLDYRYTKKNYRLNAVFSASCMGRKRFDVQDRVFVEEDNRSYDAYFRCDLPQYVLCNLSVSQTFYNKVKLTLGVDNIFNYVRKRWVRALRCSTYPPLRAHADGYSWSSCWTM